MSEALVSARVANLALSHLGSARVVLSVLTPDDSTEARALARVWPTVWRQVTQSHPWRWNSAINNLTGVPGTTRPWKYQAALPAGTGRVFSVWATGPTATTQRNTQNPFYAERTEEIAWAFELKGGTIPTLYSDVEKISVLASDTALGFATLPLEVEAAISYLLASYVAGSIIRGKEGVALAAQLMGLYGAAIRSEQVKDANQTVRYQY